MTWIVVILVALAAFAFAAFALGAPRNGWSVLGSALVLGLLGYSVQGAPDLPAAPARGAVSRLAEQGEQIVVLRRTLLGERYRVGMGQEITADAMLRNGRPEYAVALWRGMAEKQPDTAETWLALGAALLAQADGNMTPAALLAFRRAEALASGDPAVPYFLGLAELRRDELADARKLWAEAQTRAQAGSEARALIDQRLDQLDRYIAQTARNR